MTVTSFAKHKGHNRRPLRCVFYTYNVKMAQKSVNLSRCMFRSSLFDWRKLLFSPFTLESRQRHVLLSSRSIITRLSVEVGFVVNTVLNTNGPI